MSQPGTRAGVDVRSIVRIREPLVAGFAILTWLMGVGTWRLIAWAGEEGVCRDVVILAMDVPSVVDLRVDYPSRHVGLSKDCSPHQLRSTLRAGDVEEQLHFVPMLSSSTREVLFDCLRLYG